jgi:hypothetical protein
MTSPVVTSSFKRTSIKVISCVCILSFLTIQICMIVWRVSKPDDSFLNDIDGMSFLLLLLNCH